MHWCAYIYRGLMILVSRVSAIRIGIDRRDFCGIIKQNDYSPALHSPRSDYLRIAKSSRVHTRYNATRTHVLRMCFISTQEQPMIYPVDASLTLSMIWYVMDKQWAAKFVLQLFIFFFSPNIVLHTYNLFTSTFQIHIHVRTILRWKQFCRWCKKMCAWKIERGSL